MRTKSNLRRGVAIESAIYVMAVVFVMLAGILALSTGIINDDRNNSLTLLDIHTEYDIVGETFVASVINGTQFDETQFPDFTITVENDTAVIEKTGVEATLTVSYAEGRITSWKYDRNQNTSIETP